MATTLSPDLGGLGPEGARDAYFPLTSLVSTRSGSADAFGRKHKRGRAALGWRRRHEAGVRPATHSLAKAAERWSETRLSPQARLTRGPAASRSCVGRTCLRRPVSRLVGRDRRTRNWATLRLRPERRRRCQSTAVRERHGARRNDQSERSGLPSSLVGGDRFTPEAVTAAPWVLSRITGSAGGAAIRAVMSSMEEPIRKEPSRVCWARGEIAAKYGFISRVRVRSRGE